MITIHIVDDRSHPDDACRIAIQTLSPRNPEEPLRPPVSTCLAWDLQQDPDLHALFLHTLGHIYLDSGDYFEAKGVFEKARDLRIQVFGSQHPLVAETQNRLASTLRRLGELTAAHAQINEALAIDDSYFGANSVPVALDMQESAAIFLQEGNIREVQKWADKSVEILREKSDPRRASSMDLQARALQLCGKFDPQALHQAKTLYDEILAIDLQTPLVKRHSSYPTHLHNRGTVLHSLGELNLAEQDYREAIKLWTAIYGEEHPDVIDGLSNVGRVLRDKKDFDGAERAFFNALHLDKKMRGDTHPYVAYDLTNIGKLVLLRPAPSPSDLRGALQYLTEAEGILRANNLLKHGYLANTLDALGQILIRLGDLSGQGRLDEAAAIRDAIQSQCTPCEDKTMAA